MKDATYNDALKSLRGKLAKRRGWGGRVSRQLKVEAYDVYNVAHGRTKDAAILEALIEEARASEKHTDPSLALIAEFVSTEA